VRRLYVDGKYQTDDGRARLIPCSWEPFPEQPNGEFPFVLNTGRTVEHWHTRTKTGKVPILERLSPSAWVEMNPADARALRLKPQARVDIVSRRGRVRNVELRVTETVATGQLFTPFHYFEANANQVTQSAFDPISREPNYKQSAVRIEAASAEASLWDTGVVRNSLALIRTWRGSTIPLLPRDLTLGTRDSGFGTRTNPESAGSRIASLDETRDALSASRRADPGSRLRGVR
jgi:predicted molibdopterin-dependent oxidoreductase YjgC